MFSRPERAAPRGRDSLVAPKRRLATALRTPPLRLSGNGEKKSGGDRESINCVCAAVSSLASRNAVNEKAALPSEASKCAWLMGAPRQRKDRIAEKCETKAGGLYRLSTENNVYSSGMLFPKLR